MMRVAHFSDLHYATATLTEVERCFAFAVDAAITQGVDCAVIAGDATDHALALHAPAVGALARNLRRLADHCPVLLLQGTFSHEPPGMLDVFRLLGSRFPIHVAERPQQVALGGDGRWQASPGWRFDAVPGGARALFSCLPSVNKAQVAAAVGAAEAATAQGEATAAVLAGYAAINRAARAAAVPTLGVSHGTVHGCLTEHGVPMAGFDHEFSVQSLLAAQAQAFLLGHIHRHQGWQREGRHIAYAGSIGRLHYGEQGDKGFLLWQVEASAARYELIATPARRTLDVCFEGLPDLTQLRAIAQRADLPGAFVRVRWTMPEEDRPTIDRLAMAQVLAAAAEVKFEGRVVPVVRSRAAGIAEEPRIGAKIAAWAALTQTPPEPLLACLDALQAQTPEAIAAGVIDRTPIAVAALAARRDEGAVRGEAAHADDALRSP